MSIQELIKKTSAYGRMDNLQQKLIMHKTNILSIKLGVNMSYLASFENWVQKNSPRENIKEIVKSLRRSGVKEIK